MSDYQQNGIAFTAIVKFTYTLFVSQCYVLKVVLCSKNVFFFYTLRLGWGVFSLTHSYLYRHTEGGCMADVQILKSTSSKSTRSSLD